MRIPRKVFPLLLLAPPVPVTAQACAPTPQAAAQQSFGGIVTGTGGEGYRVEDAQVDLVLGRVWVRVRRCGSPEAPMILVPLQAALRGNGAGGSQEKQAFVDGREEKSQRAEIAVHAGDAVRVVAASETIQIELDATVRQQAAVGDTVDVVLNRRGGYGQDEAGQRMRGVLRAQHIVEVLP